MPITPQNGDLTAGLAGRYTETINPAVDSLLTGDVPALFSTDETVLTTQTLEALTVVGFDGAGKVVQANNTTVAAVGILVYATDTTGGDAVASIYRGGCFNPDLLVWHSGYATDAHKAKAFEGAASPTQIVIRKIQTFTPA
ncbi:head decoration protein [Ruegeria phage DSS3-P1]|uniref:head decoration protein n=1 Tax=Ruegeria phage DSS3-P1 TaxID=1555208 RepID=UPI0002357CF6|nr:head decoration protein [Ruegeria phage DSS3-P1]YP_009997274.1 head decoration protein [Ruegeria phage vB_RpoS-V18]YP_009997356.1 head decoration protein [Ruegeria phage vB_RpoS-V11]YP_009997439.1 head decoration protein [Ruegeria phage vB_RpoS-V7]AET42270.1 hypothetical protein SDSG_00004 [Ruegeria phage DSS3-P1]AIT13292.1 head decoration protein [Ruegeria phage DSS3-P1]AWY08761.1 head decoration protein [Ruegeria phage vB_RpoS-V7]AWY08933.1 head decoration protein [Ruegeria phage vB_Rpo